MGTDSVRPFTVSVQETVLADLRRRLSETRWPTDGAAAGSAGFPVSYMQSLARYWIEEYDWRAEERAINELPQFTADVRGTTIHFIHARGKGPAPIPLLFTHGWPGSFLEARKILGPLTDPEGHGAPGADSFDLIVPSLPGYAFSSKPVAAEMDVFAIADLWAELMTELGYNRFMAQGGDWGASVSTALGLRHSHRLIGIHLNYIPGSYLPYIGATSRPLADDEQAFVAQAKAWYESEGAYGHLQRTRPLTLSYALNDSPAGLAGWIVEKFRDWSDCDGNVEQRFTKAELITNVMLYWLTGSAYSAACLYLATRRRPLAFGPGERVTVPTAVLRLAKEAPFPPREWVERGYDVRRWTTHSSGGHFAALEEPDVLMADIRAFAQTLR